VHGEVITRRPGVNLERAIRAGFTALLLLVTLLSK
jgi:hypothetical protein